MSKPKNREWVARGALSLDTPNRGSVKAQVYESDGLAALLSREGGRLHLSVSRKDRHPTWDELADARYDLMPHNIEAAMIAPPPQNYVNAHPHVFHWWEIRDRDLPIERFPQGSPRTKEDGTTGAEST